MRTWQTRRLALESVTRAYVDPVDSMLVEPALQLTQVKQISRHWQWPLKQVTVTSQFGRRGRGFHYGLDLRARPGTQVCAVGDGVVVYAGARAGGFGRLVVVEHADGLYTLYAHHRKLSVRSGQKVKRGQVLGYSGSSGSARGPHLHFEVRSGQDAESIDPMVVMPSLRSYAQHKSDPDV